MATKNLTELTETTSPNASDLLYIVANSVTPQDHKITVANLLAAGGGGGGGGGGGTALVTVAAANSPLEMSLSADFVCDGTDDQEVVKQAIEESIVANSQTDTFTGSDGTISSGTASSITGLNYYSNSNASRSSNTVVAAASDNTNHVRISYRVALKASEFFSAEFTYNAGHIALYWQWTGTSSSTLTGPAAWLDGSTVYFVDSGTSAGAVATILATYTLDSEPFVLTPGNTYKVGLSYDGDETWTIQVDDVTVLTYVGPVHANTTPTLGVASRCVFFRDSSQTNSFDNVILPLAEVAGSVALLSGDYHFSGGIDLGVIGTSILGAGASTVIHCDDIAADGYAFKTTAANCNFRDLVLEGGVAAGVTGIYLDIGNARLWNCGFRDFTGADARGIWEDSGVSEIEYCWFSNCDNGIFLEGSWITTIRNSYFTICRIGIRMHYAMGAIVNGCHFEGGYSAYNTDYGIYAYDDFGYNDSGMHQVTGNRFYDWTCDEAAIFMEYQFSCLIGNNNLCEVGTRGIQLVQCSNGLVEGNTLTFIDVAGITVTGCDDMTITGNYLSEAGDGTDSVGILVGSGGDGPTNSTRTTITNNTLRASSPISGDAWYGYTPDYGIRLVSGATNTIVYGNDIRDTWGVSAFTDGGTGTITTMTGNWT